MQGRDVRSVRVLVPDSRGLDQNPLQELSVAPPAVATCSPSSHGVATAGSGGDVSGSQETIPSDSAE